MLKCFGATRLLSDAKERPLGSSERMALRLHLLMCSACRRFGRQVDVLRRAARAYAAGGTGPEDGGS